MADQKLTDLTALASLSTDDIFYVVDDPSGVPANKKVTVATIDDRYLLESNNLSDLDNAATARTNLGLVAGGAGDIWVEKAGDTMTGDLTFSGQFHPVLAPGSDTNFVFLEGTVTGTPQMTWIEADDVISFTHGINVNGNSSFEREGSSTRLQFFSYSSVLATDSPQFDCRRTRGTEGAQTVVSDNDRLALFAFRGHDGTDNATIGAQILCKVDGTPAGNSIPTELQFSITPDGGSLQTAPPSMVIRNSGNVGIAKTSPTAMLHVDQTSTTGAKPVLLLDQADVSEEMIEFTSTVGVGNAIEAVGAKTLTTTHFIKVTITGVGTRYIPVGTIA